MNELEIEAVAMKPCRKCDGAAVHRRHKGALGTHWSYVYCTKCDFTTQHYETASDAINEWNARNKPAQDAKLRETLLKLPRYDVSTNSHSHTDACDVGTEEDRYESTHAWFDDAPYIKVSDLLQALSNSITDKGE